MTTPKSQKTMPNTIDIFNSWLMLMKGEEDKRRIYVRADFWYILCFHQVSPSWHERAYWDARTITAWDRYVQENLRYLAEEGCYTGYSTEEDDFWYGEMIEPTLTGMVRAQR